MFAGEPRASPGSLGGMGGMDLYAKSGTPALLND